MSIFESPLKTAFTVLGTMSDLTAALWYNQVIHRIHTYTFMACTLYHVRLNAGCLVQLYSSQKSAHISPMPVLGTMPVLKTGALVILYNNLHKEVSTYSSNVCT